MAVKKPKKLNVKRKIVNWYLAHPKKLKNTPHGDREAQRSWSIRRKANYAAGAISRGIKK